MHEPVLMYCIPLRPVVTAFAMAALSTFPIPSFLFASSVGPVTLISIDSADNQLLPHNLPHEDEKMWLMSVR